MGGPGPTLLSELPRQIAGCIATYTRPTDMATLPIMGRGSITACVITMRGQPIMPPVITAGIGAITARATTGEARTDDELSLGKH